MPYQLDGDLDLLASKADLLNLFAAPVCKFLWPDSEALNAELKRVILAKMEESPGVVHSNRRGWHSKKDLHTWPDECVQEFLARACALVRKMIRRTVPNATEAHLNDFEFAAWANVNQKGAFNKAHHHFGYGTMWSSFYYVDTGADESGGVVSGYTKFQDRSGTPKEILRNPNPYEREVTIIPKAGLMVLFPAMLYHFVETYRGDGTRITIAFNVKHRGFVIPCYEGMVEPTWWWTNFRGLMIIPQKAPEKLRALALLPGKLLARKLPRSFRLRPWKEYLNAAIDHATAEASAQTEKKMRAPAVHP